MRGTSKEAYRVANLFNWSRGIRDRRLDLLMFPENALTAGENVELAEFGLKTRPGYSVVGMLTAEPQSKRIELLFEGNTGDTQIIDSTQRHTVTNVALAGGERMTIDESQYYPSVGLSSLRVPPEHEYQTGEYKLTVPASDDFWLGGVYDWPWEMSVYFRRSGSLSHEMLLAGYGHGPNRWEWWYNLEPLPGQEKLTFRMYEDDVIVLDLSSDIQTSVDEWWSFIVRRYYGDPGWRYYAMWRHNLATGNSYGQDWFSLQAMPPITGSGQELVLLNTYRGDDIPAWFGYFSIEWPPPEAQVNPVVVNSLHQVRFPTNEKSFLLAQVTDPDNGASAVYASNTLLPSDSVDFSQVYALGSHAGRMSVAVLNDRAVITEGEATVPLVFAGGMSEDASDWAYPKAVLVRQDGVNAYDISSQVLDKDTTNYASVGDIQAAGDIIICTDVPKVEAFYFEMHAPNVVASTLPPYSDQILLNDYDNFDQLDLKGAITHWVQDSGATGHFERRVSLVGAAVDLGGTPNTVKIPCQAHGFAAGNSVTIVGTTNYNATCTLPSQAAGDADNFVIEAAYNAETFSGDDEAHKSITLGSGNDCPEVEQMVQVVFSDATLVIYVITDDGEGSGEVELNDDHATGEVTEIRGIYLFNNSACLGATAAFNGTTFTASPSSTRTFTVGSGTEVTVRQIIPGSLLTTSGLYVRVTVTAYLGSAATVSLFSGVFANINDASIVERSGSTAGGTEAVTPLYFSAGASLQPNGTNTISITSDWVRFSLDEAKDYLVSLEMSAGWYYRWGVVQQFYGNPLLGFASTGGGYYTGFVSASSQSGTGFSYVGAGTVGVSSIEVVTPQSAPTLLHVGITTQAEAVPVVVAEEFAGVTVTEDTPGSSKLYHAITLDDRSTFQVFKSAAWRTIVRLSGSDWQYNNSATTTPAWVNATVNSLLGALKQAFGVAANQMTGAGLNAITPAQWIDDGGVVIHTTPTMGFAFGMLADGVNVPTLTSYTVSYSDAGTAAIEGWRNGQWTADIGWTDGTAVASVPLAQSGIISYNDAVPFEADYHVISEVPGFWYRLRTSQTSEYCSITRVLYKAPCQPLSNIGDGQPDTPLAFIYHDTSASVIRDYTIEVSDETLTEFSKANIPMATDDYIYLAYLTRFNDIEITPYEQNNQNAAVLSVEYWNGERWKALSITDGTSVSNKTLTKKGKISWNTPDDWKTHIPLEANFPLGYWMRFKVSASLSDTSAISEVKVYGVPSALTKHKFAVAVKDRIALLGRPDAPDQADISRQLEEYGFTGNDSGSWRIGGMDAIHCALAAWNGLLVGKTETWHQLTGNDPSDFQFQTVEAARHVPVNSSVIVKASVMGFDDGERYGIYFINRYGAFAVTGLATDGTYGTARGQEISAPVNWWTADGLPRIDLNNVGISCGVFWPPANWILWAVPMILTADQTEQTTNNRLIVYDLALGAWLPPFTISVASLCLAYHHSATAPGKLGDIGLYAGDYTSQILRLFAPNATTDGGATIAAWVETGWLHFGSPEFTKVLRLLTAFGKTSGDKIIIEIYTDGDESSPTVLNCESLSILADRSFGQQQVPNNIAGRFFKLRILLQDTTDFYGLQLGLSLIREWGEI